MKNKNSVASCVGALAALSLCQASPFQNLNFDNANTNTLFDGSGFGDYYGPNGDLIPGWQLFDAGIPTGPIGFNISAPGSGYTSIFSPAFAAHVPVIGLYSFGMIPDLGAPGTFRPMTLSQSGDVPTGVQSIHFLIWGAPLLVQANGSPIGLSHTPIARQPDWNSSISVFEAAGDISAFAGQTVELKFTTVEASPFQYGIDEIYFSMIGVPEPSTLVLFSLGGLALLARRFRRE